MFTVYILQSKKDGTFYTGLTSDLVRRLREHNLGWEESTKRHRPYDVIFTKIVSTRAAARRLEKQLKSGYLRELRKNLYLLKNKLQGD